MIRSESRSLEWIQELRKQYPQTNPTLIEKTIRAFSLLEALSVSGCPFIFKGGTSLMLHLDSRKRLSIDVDIICKPGTDVVSYLRKTSSEYGFGEIESVDRISRNHVPKTHAKCFYEVSYGSPGTGTILLDVLFDEVEYCQVERHIIKSPFLMTAGEPVYVRMPSLMDLLGDKMTAFAPNTTGIPYYKGDKRCSMEIIKQLYDIAAIFDRTDSLEVARKSFNNIAPLELAYRKLPVDNLNVIFDDIVNVSRIICTWGYDDAYQFEELSDGVNRVRDFIHSERFSYDSAIICASKAAYLAALMRLGIDKVSHYDKSILLLPKLHPAVDKHLVRLRKSSPEAYYYWQNISSLIL